MLNTNKKDFNDTAKLAEQNTKDDDGNAEEVPISLNEIELTEITAE